MSRRRDSKDIAAAMLTVALQRKGASKVDMLYGARQSNSEGSALLNRIIAAKLLKVDDAGNRYQITKDGHKFLKAYKMITHFLPSRK